MSTTETPEVRPPVLRYRLTTAGLLLAWTVGLASAAAVFADGLDAAPVWNAILGVTSIAAMALNFTFILRARRSDVAAIAGNSQDERQRLLGLKSQAVASAAVLVYGCLLIIGGLVAALSGVTMSEPVDVATALIVIALGILWTHGVFLLLAARHYSRKE